MTGRKIGWSLSAGDPWTDGLLLAAGAAVVAAAGGAVVWVAGSAVWLLTGHGFGPGLVDAGRVIARGEGLGEVWPGISSAALVGVVAVLVVAGISAAAAAVTAWGKAHPPRDGYAPARHFADLLPGRLGERKAKRLRPSLTGVRKIAPSDLGIPIGRLRARGPLLRATWEDVVLAICAPRAGKTTCLAVPAVLDAPGPVVATSNKADLWEHTRHVRAEATGERVWTFDPQQITRTGQGFCWDALAGVSTVSDARRLAGHFVQEIRRTAESADFWDRDAEDLLTGLLLAAAVGGATLTEVGAWLTSVSSVEPRNILARAGFTQLAEVMAGRSQGAVETREGVYATARAAAACLADPQIMTWVTPQAGLDVFDPAAFVRSRQTLYLLSKDGAGSAAPLVAAFADRVMLEAVRAAEVSPGGRLDPPMVAVLDEAANICQITELPRLYSHLGSRGVSAMTILQSRSQGQRVWGQSGMAELFSASTVKVVGAGVDEQAFAEDLSRMIGSEDVLVRTLNGGRGGGVAVTTRRERVLPADEVRALPKFSGLLLVTGVRPAKIQLVPWMDGPKAEQIRRSLQDPR